MSKRNKIIYWIATIWMSLGIVSSAIVQLTNMKEEADMFEHLGYPAYLMTILGVWKILGVITALIPKFPLLKEWAYAGFFFVLSGAIVSHFVMGDSMGEVFPAFFTLVLTAVSWYFRPADRKIGSVKHVTE